MKKILINANQKEEIRIALINNKNLYDLNIENNKNKQKKNNIYTGKINKIVPSLNAVFIDYGELKNGFLPIKYISSKYLINKKNIKNNLYIGQKLIVQINKDEYNNKGATLTTFISLIGNYIILMPNKNKIYISKKIPQKQRKKLKHISKKLILPKNMGLIIRTSACKKNIHILQLDIYLKLKHWKIIKKKFNINNTKLLIYKQNNMFIKILKYYLIKDIKEIIIDNLKIYKLLLNYIKQIKKLKYINKIKLYKKKIPLFNYFKIEKQIELSLQQKVKLPSGGYITIESTEALTSIDVNSSKYNTSINIENTALETNLEATIEIAKQIKLRNLGGLIVIDFIDMYILNNKKFIEKKFKKNINNDIAKIKIGFISKFGLLEMSRQRLNLSLKKLNYSFCTICKGIGTIRNIKSISLYILRNIITKSLKQKVKTIKIIINIDISNYLLKNKKYILDSIKKKKINIKIITNKYIKIHNYSIIIKKHKINIFNLKKNNKIKIKKNNFNLNKLINFYIYNKFIFKIKKLFILIKNININYIYNRIINKKK